MSGTPVTESRHASSTGAQTDVYANVKRIPNPGKAGPYKEAMYVMYVCSIYNKIWRPSACLSLGRGQWERPPRKVWFVMPLGDARVCSSSREGPS
jgi:hypothetical protein